MIFKDSYKLLVANLRSIFEEGEIHSIARILYEDLFGLLGAETSSRVMTQGEIDRFNRAQNRLLDGEPIDYITGIREFYGRRFRVNEAVLIPRQETEELVSWILEDIDVSKSLKIVDIGTGSGCISITLDLESKLVNEVVGIDISDAALDTARQNNDLLEANVQFNQSNILEDSMDLLGDFDVIVSNPPYILSSERSLMNDQVLDHEPDIALFTEGEDPLVFYKMINQIALRNLKSGGHLYYEISALHKDDMMSLMDHDGFINVTARKDISGNWRMIKAMKQ